MQKLKGILADPGNRPAVSLLMYSSIAMAVVPLAVYFACFHILFAEGVSPEPPPSPRHCRPFHPQWTSNPCTAARSCIEGRERERERERVRLSHVVGPESVPWREITTWCGAACVVEPPPGTRRHDYLSSFVERIGEGKEGAWQHPFALAGAKVIVCRKRRACCGLRLREGKQKIHANREAWGRTCCIFQGILVPRRIRQPEDDTRAPKHAHPHSSSRV